MCVCEGLTPLISREISDPGAEQTHFLFIAVIREKARMVERIRFDY